MKTKKWILLIVILIVLIGTTYFFFMRNNEQNNNSYEANRTSYNEINTNITQNTVQDKNQNQTSSDNKNVIHITQGITNYEPVEEQLTNFTTKIYSKDPARQNNINITCQTLNSTVVANGDTFSFCNIVGPATSDKGYQEADIFDNKGKKKKGLGGR